MTLTHFKTYFTEAKISKDNLETTLKLITSLIQKKLSTKLFRFGGPKGYVELTNGLGILYFYNIKNKTKAIRFNYVNGSIDTVTLWKAYMLGDSGDYTVNLGTLNLTQSASKLIEILMSDVPKKEYALYVEDTQSFTNSILSEAKRTTPEEFYSFVNDALYPSENIGRLSWDRLTAIALNKDVQVPTLVRTTKIKGTNFYDLSSLLTAPDHDKPGAVEPTYYIKVTAQDPNTKKFLSVKGDEKAGNILKTIGTALNNPSEENIQSFVRNPDTLFANMKSLTKVVARGARNSLVITGGAGVGKSFTVFEAIKEEGLVKNQDWYLIKGKITTAALYQNLYIHREGTLLVFDDTDSVWGDQDAANILKAALDSYDERFVSWYSGRTTNISILDDIAKEDYLMKVDDELRKDPGSSKIKLPSEFEYKGRIIFISNLTQDKLDPAVLNRSAKIDMTLTNEEVFARIESILGFIGNKDVPIEIKKEILDFIKVETRKGVLDAPSIRTFVGAEDLYRSGLPNWRELMQYI